MNEYIPIFAYAIIAVAVGLIFLHQNHGFLKDDVKYLEKRIQSLEKEVLELRYRREK